MKNMLDELKKMDVEESIEIVPDFKDKVMNKINAKNENSDFKYIIPALSFAAVVMTVSILVNFNEDYIRKKYVLKEDNTEVIMATDEPSTQTNESRGMMATNLVANKFADDLEIIEKSQYDVYSWIIEIMEINDIDYEKIETGAIKVKMPMEDAEIMFREHIDLIQISESSGHLIISNK